MEPEQMDRATEMLMRSTFGKPRAIVEDSRMSAALLVWVDNAPFLMAGCTAWRGDAIPVVGDSWAWLGQPGVVYCSEACVETMMKFHKCCLYECDICGDHTAKKLCTPLGGLILVAACCPACAAFPEAFAGLN